MKISVLLVLATVSTTWAASPGPLPPKADQDLARDILRELVDINTTHEHGSTAAAQVIQQQSYSSRLLTNPSRAVSLCVIARRGPAPSQCCFLDIWT
jgi:hypothetical protein